MSSIVYDLLHKIPPGKVATYKELARAAGYKSPRVVGNILHRNKNPKKYPCHRVVRSDGKLGSGYAFGGPSEQERKLRAESVAFIPNTNKVDLEKALCILTE